VPTRAKPAWKALPLLLLEGQRLTIVNTRTRTSDGLQPRYCGHNNSNICGAILVAEVLPEKLLRRSNNVPCETARVSFPQTYCGRSRENCVPKSLTRTMPLGNTRALSQTPPWSLRHGRQISSISFCTPLKLQSDYEFRLFVRRGRDAACPVPAATLIVHKHPGQLRFACDYRAQPRRASYVGNVVGHSPEDFVRADAFTQNVHDSRR
jgi:hypothetical protein